MNSLSGELSNDAMLSIEELAQVLRKTPNCIRKWIAELGLPVRCMNRVADSNRGMCVNMGDYREWSAKRKKVIIPKVAQINEEYKPRSNAGAKMVPIR